MPAQHNTSATNNVPIPQAQNHAVHQFIQTDNQRYRGLNSNGAEVRRRLIHNDSKSNMIKDICVLTVTNLKNTNTIVFKTHLKVKFYIYILQLNKLKKTPIYYLISFFWFHCPHALRYQCILIICIQTKIYIDKIWDWS